MGLADYGVILKPDKEAVPISAIILALRQEGFVREKMTQDYNGAHLAAPPIDRAAFTRYERHAEGTEFLLEALVRWIPGESESPLLHNLSLRFAVCQSENATEAFLNEVERLCRKCHLVALANGKEYRLKTLQDYRKTAEAEIRQQKVRWHEMFGPDSEEIALPVEAVWAHFMQQPPELLEQQTA